MGLQRRVRQRIKFSGVDICFELLIPRFGVKRTDISLTANVRAKREPTP